MKLVQFYGVVMDVSLCRASVSCSLHSSLEKQERVFLLDVFCGIFFSMIVCLGCSRQLQLVENSLM